MIEPTKTVHISQYKNGVITEVDDTTLSEYHLTLYVNGQRQVVISCTPEHLEEMVLGYLLSEGFVKDLSQVEHINFSGDWSLADVWVKQENKPGLVSDCAYVKSDAVFQFPELSGNLSVLSGHHVSTIKLEEYTALYYG